MKKFWFLAAGFIIGTPLRSSADTVKTDSPPKVEESSSDTDKAAVNDASTAADQWAIPKSTPVAAAPPIQAETPKPAAAAPAAPRSGLNEMRGKLESKNYDPKTVRLTVEGGYNVEFAYDEHTTIVNGGNPVSIDDLGYGDELIIRYLGKELTAVEIDRVAKASRPQ